MVGTAFLLGRNIDRPVYLLPPPEAVNDKGTLWTLQKCVYGLNDASRSWYHTVKKELLSLRAEILSYDQAIFTWFYNGKFHGIISTHVDDFCWGGTKMLLIKLCQNLL